MPIYRGISMKHVTIKQLGIKQACLLLLFSWFFLSMQLPERKSYVNDFTSTLTDEQVAYLDKQLHSMEFQEGVQMVVVVIDSLENASPSDVAQAFATQWQVGHKGRDSGILVLIAKKEAQSWIDLGYALDQNITDDRAKQIELTTIDPLLKRGKIYAAIENGLSQIFTGFGKSMSPGGAITVGSFWDMTGLIVFLVSIPLLFIVARFASSKHMWVSPVVGFAVGYLQSIGLAVALACMGALMVLISYLIKTFTPPRQD